MQRKRAEADARGEAWTYDRACLQRDPADVARLEAQGAPKAVRFRVPPGQTRFKDLVHGEITFDNANIEDFVILRSDAQPTYHLSVVVDDIDMEITHVVRGDDHISNTPKQVLLYRAFGRTPPVFAHFPLMLGKDRKKLSKRTGDTSLQEYRDKGYPPEAVLNFLCLQGWALDDKTTVFSIRELVQRFDPRDVSPSGSIFDPEKLLWMAGEYIRRDGLERVAERCAPFVAQAGLASAEELAARRPWYLAAVASEKERIRLYSELPGRISYLFAADGDLVYQEDALAAARKHPARLDTLASYLEWLGPRLEPLEPARLRDATKQWVKERGLAMPALFQPLRCALTGASGGVDLFEAMALLGPARVRARLERAVERL
jgi:glutamyl-tRNA synthetase